MRHFEIIRDNLDITVKVNGSIVMQVSLNESLLADYDSICFGTGQGANVTIDNIVVGETSEPIDSGKTAIDTTDVPWVGILAGITGVAVLALIGGQSYIKKKRARRVVNQKIMNRQIIQNISQEFNLSNYGLASLVTGVYRVDSRYQDEEFQKLIPQELLEYRYLMQPTRLTIMKLLTSQTKMRSTEIKHLLSISWSELSNHLKSLEEKGFVEMVDEFNEDGHVVQTVYIKPEGRKEFLELFTLLQQFVSNLSPVGDILSDDDTQFFQNDLYPK